MQSSESANTPSEISAFFGTDGLTFQKISFADKYIINVLVNGVIDSTYDIPLLTSQTINKNLQDEESLGAEPITLMGDPNNFKLQVIASQIGKVVLQSGDPRNVILSLSSRWFGPKDESQPDDFDRLMFVLQHVKKLM